MRILIYTHAFPPMVGGIETITMQLAKGLAGRLNLAGTDERAEVTVVTPTAARCENEANLPFRIVRRPSIAKLATLIRRTDVLHIAGPNMLPLLLGRLFRKPTVVEHHGFQTACPSGQLVYQPQPCPCPGRFMAGNYRACLTCNSHNGVAGSVKQLFLTFVRRKLCLGVSANVMPTAWLGSVVRLPRAVTIHHGLPAKSVTNTAEPCTPPAIVFQGRLVSTKGVSTLLKAARLLSDCDFELQIIGDGPDRTRLEREAARLKLAGKVNFLGFLSPLQIEPAVARAKAVVMPSLGGEVFGLVALENMQRGKAVVVSEIGALSEVVGNPDLTFPPGDEVALAARLRRVLQSPEFVQEAGNKAAERAGTMFTVDQMVTEHLTLYQRLLPHFAGNRLAQVA